MILKKLKSKKILKRIIKKRNTIISKLLKFLPLILFLIIWELAVRNSKISTFLFGTPSLVIKNFIEKISDGSLIVDTYITAIETFLGFLLGNIIGSILGLSLWYSKKIADIAKPYIIAIGSIPIFALAPMMIMWFGTGIFSKIMMAAFSTVVVAIVQAYNGALNVDSDQINLLKTFGANRNQIFKKIIVQSSLVWVLASYRLNIGFALLGAFIGEFISSEKGLGHLIIRAGGLYNIPLVLVGVFCIILIALILSYLVGIVERKLLFWRYA